MVIQNETNAEPPVNDSPLLPVETISQPGQLELAVREMKGAPEIALDTESNSFHHYPEQLCLIQLATRHKVYLIDTIALADLGPLKAVLADGSTVKVLHGADYDVRSLDRFCGARFRNLYDTSIAARFAGLTQFGLGALVKDLLGLTIDKSTRLQRSDWARRPLSDEARTYAASDVRHLFALRKILDQRLRDLNRTAWVAEECARLEDIRFTPPDLENAHLNLKGTHGLNGRALAILKSLLAFREKEAVRRGRPPFFVLPDAALIHLATHPSTALQEVPGLEKLNLQWIKPGLLQALRDGLAAPPAHRPPSTQEHVSYALLQLRNKRLGLLKEWRTSLGKSLSLDPSLLWPTASFERLAADPDSLGTELVSGTVRRWQGDQFTASLRDFLKTLP